MYAFYKSHFLLPDDPQGRNGPPLNEFLEFPNTGEDKERIL